MTFCQRSWVGVSVPSLGEIVNVNLSKTVNRYHYLLVCLFLEIVRLVTVGMVKYGTWWKIEM